MTRKDTLKTRRRCKWWRYRTWRQTPKAKRINRYRDRFLKTI